MLHELICQTLKYELFGNKISFKLFDLKKRDKVQGKVFLKNIDTAKYKRYGVMQSFFLQSPNPPLPL